MINFRPDISCIMIWLVIFEMDIKSHACGSDVNVNFYWEIYWDLCDFEGF